MEEEVNYSTVVFKRNGLTPPKEKKERKETQHEDFKESVRPKAENKVATKPGLLCLMTACCGILCVGLLCFVIYVIVEMDKERAETQELNGCLEKETETLSRKRNFLSALMKYETFPVAEYCPKNNCQPCPQNWMLFMKRCYVIHLKWQSWKKSQSTCKKDNADLVVIDSFEEQQFLSNSTEVYTDKFHGYWIGLESDDDENWRWVNGFNDTLKYWVKEGVGDGGPCAQLMPNIAEITAKWDTAKCYLTNRFICEKEAIVWP